MKGKHVFIKVLIESAVSKETKCVKTRNKAFLRLILLYKCNSKTYINIAYIFSDKFNKPQKWNLALITTWIVILKLCYLIIKWLPANSA